jgi:1-acyl-sn-glycerol-3-phosphate acyltransferase
MRRSARYPQPVIAGPTDEIQPRDERGLLYRFACSMAGAFYGLLFRMRVAGLANVPLTGSALLASNHVSVLDPVPIAVAVSRRGRVIRFLAAVEFFDKPFIGRWLRRFEQIPIRRGGADWEAMNQVAKAIAAGTLTGIFPEGRVRAQGEPRLPGLKGVARLALVAGVSVVPVGVWGTQARWPRGHIRWGPPLRPRLAVVFGPPVEAVGNPRNRADVRGLTDRIMVAVGEAEDHARRLADPSGPQGRRTQSVSGR